MTHSRLAAAPLANLPACRADAPSEDQPEPAGPGWYESSWDLRRGLDVCEAPWPDAWATLCRAAG